MIKQRNTIYLVEGEDEKIIVSLLKTEFRLIRPGKISVLNILQKKITPARAANWESGIDVVLVFDTDVRRTSTFDQNISLLKKMNAVHDIVFIPQVRNLEDELLRASNIKHIREITKSRTDEEWKGDLRKCSNLQHRFREIGFEMQKFWNTRPVDDFVGIPNQSEKIRIKRKR